MNEEYLYFDDLTNSWQPCTLEQIAALDNPDLGICPLNADGTPGAQTTYAALMKKIAAQNSWNNPKTNNYGTSQRYEYKVLSHMKFNKGFFGDFNTDELEKKINQHAAKGYRLAAMTSFQLSASTPLEGVLAVMEKDRFSTNNTGNVN